MKSLQKDESIRYLSSALWAFHHEPHSPGEQHSPVVVYQDEQDHRIARCLKCGATGLPQQDVLTARAALMRG